MKYLSLICRGHIPVIKNQGWTNQKDIKQFLRYFLPRGQKHDRKSFHQTARSLHLAFKNMETEEIYDVLMEQLVGRYPECDPHY